MQRKVQNAKTKCKSSGDPDLELSGGGGEGGFVLLTLPAFLPSVISSFFHPK